MPDVKITAQKNGSYKVEGPVELYYGDSKIEVTKSPIFLCRCGSSANKPFCDGTHKKIAFKG